ncbi:8017_t:CDS:2 [Paraglomus occultum]|uniref:8017_t:CDS:1 n=1 Tax=Paraglomus occultum TaxID=144539 RepID=A0A9N8Z8V7_9GLOM|nr:8017_t:CDS:2 [Paraglomus occultum]
MTSRKEKRAPFFVFALPSVVAGKSKKLVSLLKKSVNSKTLPRNPFRRVRSSKVSANVQNQDNTLHESRTVQTEKTRIIKATSQLLYESGTSAWPEFFNNPTEPAKHTVDEGNDTEWIGYGEISMSPYDTAWVAMIPSRKYKATQQPQDFELAFPQCFAWLLQAQDENGSWARTGPGSIAPALAAVLALGSFRTRAAEFFEQKLANLGISKKLFSSVYEKGIEFLRITLNGWNIDELDMTGFEIVIPSLLSALEKLTPPVTFDFPDQSRLYKENQRKLSIIPIEAIFALAARRQPITIVHSLESFTNTFDMSKCQNEGFQAINGSYGSSPAATAAVLIAAQEWDEKAYVFLKKIIDNRPSHASKFGYVPTLCDVGIFETCWIAHCVGEMIMSMEGNPSTDFSTPLMQELTSRNAAFITYMKALLKEQKGVLRWVSWDNRIPGDVDDTGVANYLIRHFDADATFDLSPITKTFWNGRYFITYPLERTFSVSVNVHILNFLLSERERARVKETLPIMVPTITKTGVTRQADLDNIIITDINWMAAQRNQDHVWKDKWNRSPWYTTMKSIQVLLSLRKYPDMLAVTSFKNLETLHAYCRKSIDRALSVQHEDGTWGEASSDAQGNVEETSYVVRMLKEALRVWSEDEELKNALVRGRQYLLRHFDEAMNDKGFFHNKQPFLWVNKQLYTVPRILRASMLSALWED